MTSSKARLAAWGMAAMALPQLAHAATPRSCADLAHLAMPRATVTAAQTVEAGQYQAPGGPLAGMFSQPGMNLAGHTQEGANPAFCRLAATLAPARGSAIRIEVWLPLNGWNGKFLGVGSFGWGGSIMTGGMLAGVREGYAVASTDTGHDADTQGQGGQFSLGHPQQLIDYAYRADHLMTLDAKAVIRAFYGKGPARSYWIGCSLGGLEGLIEAKRYPADYDGIVAGAPPNPIIAFNAQQLWPGWLVHSDAGLLVPQRKIALVNAAILRACASPVGQQQGFLDQPEQCQFQPRSLQCKDADAPDCLTGGQLALIEQAYRGPVDPRNGQVIFPGPAIGATAGLDDLTRGKPFTNALDMFRYTAFQDPQWDWSTMDWGKDVARATATVGPLMHVDADLRPFFARGGKLLMYIGWYDGHNPQELIGYYKALMRKAGDTTRGAARLFTIPGMGHCAGGAGCDTFDKLGAIDRWVDGGRAPERIVASKVVNGQVTRTRPICAWPAVAHYQGSGAIDAAESFTCG